MSKLLDQYGRPIDARMLAAEYAEKNERRGLFQKKDRPRLGTGAQITPEYIYSAIRAAENGETVKLQDLLFRVSFDPRVTADATKRLDKLRLFAWDVEPYESDGAAAGDAEDEHAAFAKEVLSGIPRFRRLLVHLNQAVLFGWSLVEIRWDWHGDKYLPVDFRARPPRDFRPLSSGGFERWESFGWSKTPIDPYRFLTHSVERDGSPILGGLLLRCVFPVIAKNWTWTQWSKLLDLVGGGISAVTFDPLLGGNLTNAQRVAETTGRQLWAAMSSAYKIQRHFPDGRAAGHKDFHYEANAAISEVLTGARLTTDQGEKGARSLGVVHQDELDDLRAGDAEDLAETITAQLLVPLIAINFGPQERYPRFRLYHDESTDLQAELAVDRGLYEMGLPLSIDDVRQRYGRSAPLDTGNDVLQKTTTNAASSLADSSRENAANDEDEPAVGGATMRLHRALLPAAGESVSACELRVAGLLAAKGGAAADTTAPAEVFALDADLERRMRDACADAPSVAAMEGRLRDLLQGVERDHTGRVAYLLYHTSALGFLAGRYQVMRDAADLRALRSFAGRAMRTFSTVIDDWSDLPMQEAVDWFKRKGVIDADLWQQIEPDLRKRSFYAAKLGTVNQMQTAHSAILRGLETGASRESVVKEMAGQFGKQVNRAYLRFLFDQNVATAQSHARWMRQKETIFDRPFGRYLTMGDADVRDAHRELHGTVLPLADGWWASNYPPNGYGCRCYVDTYDQATLDRRGFTVADSAPRFNAPAPFNTNPGQMDSAQERRNALDEAAAAGGLLSGYQPPASTVITGGQKPIIEGEY